MLQENTLIAIRAHAERDYPREACGFVVAKGRKEQYIPCENLSAVPGEQFRMSQTAWADAEDTGKILALVHSHPDQDAALSEADRVACEATGVPWVVISVREGIAGEIRSANPDGYRAPLVGRGFYHGVLDCYALIKDYYERELGIELPEPERPDDWWNNGGNLYMDNYAAAGFHRLPDGAPLQKGDVILMAVRSPVPNHGAVYMGATTLSEDPHALPLEGAMLHHLYGRLSERTIYGGYWAECTACILRHGKMMA